MRTLWLLLGMGWAVARAQVCTPDTTVTGLEPDTLPDAYVGSQYDEVVYFQVPTSRTVFNNTFVVDSAHVDTIRNFPATFTYQCNKPNCLYAGGEYGCARITGTPAPHDTGTRHLVVEVTVYTVVNGSVVTFLQVDSLPFTVRDTGAVSTTAALRADPDGGIRWGPNPFRHTFYLEMENVPPGKVNIAVYDLLGQRITRTLKYHPGGRLAWQWVPGPRLPGGLYLLHVQTPSRRFIRRIHYRVD